MTKSHLFMIPLALLLLGADDAKDSAIKDVRKSLDALNEAFKDRDVKKVQQWMTDGHVAITPYYGGPQNKTEQMQSLPDLKMSEYKPGAIKIVLLNKETALVTYPLTLKGTYKGNALPTKNFASSLWVLQGGKWLESFYQETALPQ